MRHNRCCSGVVRDARCDRDRVSWDPEGQRKFALHYYNACIKGFLIQYITHI